MEEHSPARSNKRLALVTGVSGLLGANLALVLEDGGYTVAGVSRKTPTAAPGRQHFAMDISEGSGASELIERLSPAVIYHCAAETSVDKCEDDPGWATRMNVIASGTLARAASQIAAKLVYISTDSVFDGERGGYNEHDAPGPINAYAKSKLQGEEAVRQASDNHLIVRVNLFGFNAQAAKTSLAEWILSSVRAERRIPGFRDVMFSPLFVPDLAKILIEASAKGLCGVYHAGARDHCSKLDFARSLAEAFELDSNLVEDSSSDTVQFRAARPKRTWLKVSRLETALGHPMPSIGEGIARIRHFAEHGELARLRGTANQIR